MQRSLARRGYSLNGSFNKQTDHIYVYRVTYKIFLNFNYDMNKSEEDSFV
jgi:hypothetical protein